MPGEEEEGHEVLSSVPGFCRGDRGPWGMGGVNGGDWTSVGGLGDLGETGRRCGMLGEVRERLRKTGRY